MGINLAHNNGIFFMMCKMLLFCCEVVLIYISEAFVLVHVNDFILSLFFTVKIYFIVVAEYVHKPWCLIQVFAPQVHGSRQVIK